MIYNLIKEGGFTYNDLKNMSWSEVNEMWILHTERTQYLNERKERKMKRNQRGN